DIVTGRFVLTRNGRINPRHARARQWIVVEAAEFNNRSLLTLGRATTVRRWQLLQIGPGFFDAFGRQATLSRNMRKNQRMIAKLIDQSRHAITHAMDRSERFVADDFVWLRTGERELLAHVTVGFFAIEALQITARRHSLLER